MSTDRPLRVALLSYRSKPHCGGQGIYLRHLSRELAALGHHVEVFSGQPYPELEPGPVLRELPSLDLYADDDPFRTPALSEYRDWIDVLEFGAMKTGAFPEPLTFSLRALRALRAPGGRLRPGARQPGAGLRDARPGPARPAPGDQHPPPDQRGPADRAGLGPGLGPGRQVALVLLRPDAGPGGPPGRAGAHRLAGLPRRHLPGLRGRPGQRARDPAGRGHPAVPPPARRPASRAGSWPWPAPTPR